jgi:phosphatidylserine/phosphatidylglycerophosphate/cardiolipin synthase-like enzyme
MGRPPLCLCLPLIAAALAGCGAAPAGLGGSAPRALPLPPGIQVAFNHRGVSRYRSPVSGHWRQGDDLEAMLLASIAAAREEILVAVQELSLSRVAEALVAARARGVRVQVVLENTYAEPWSRLHPADLSPHQRRRVEQLRALGQGDAVDLLLRGGVPLIDDTADGSRGSGLMHHKFLVVDGQVVVTGSANFTPSCIHGDADDPRSRGNVNHLLRFESPALAALFREEFRRMWGDGPGGAADSRFGLAKASVGPRRVWIGPTAVEVLFTPHPRRDPHHGLAWLEAQLAQTRRRADLSLFVFSAQNLADALARLRARGARIRLVADPGFAHRSFSEVLDLLALHQPDHHCRLEAGNRPWSRPLESVGTPRLAAGDKLHHKFAVLDRRRVISGSFNWSPAAAHQNDETLLRIDSPQLARHFEAEMDRLWRGAELGVTARLERARQRRGRLCGSGRARLAADDGSSETRGTIKPAPAERAPTPWIRPPAPSPRTSTSPPSWMPST